MPTMTKTSSRGWIYRWDSMGDYDVTMDTDTKIVLTYSEDRGGPFDPDRSPFDIVMKVTDGIIKKVTWRNEDGDSEAVLTGVNFEVDMLRVLTSEDIQNGDHIYRMMVAEGTTFQMVNQARDNAGFDIQTGVGDDIVRAKGGNAYIKDSGGADRYIGDDNWDQVTYDEWFWRAPERVERGIRADLREEYVIGPDGERDVIKNIEGIRGTFKRDVLLGDKEDNEFYGYRGKDVIDGRGGFDFVQYRRDADQGGTAGVTVNLNKGYAIDGFGKRDTLKNIEGVEGTDFDDVIIGNSKDNEFDARGGADTFIFRGNNFGIDEINEFNPEDGDRIRIVNADSLSDVRIAANEHGEQSIYFNNSEIFLNNYTGEVEQFLLF